MTKKEAVAVACMEITDPLYLPDNETGPCECGKMLQYRPYAEYEGIKKLCIECCNKLAKKEGGLKPMVAKSFHKEVNDFFASKGAPRH